MRCVIASDSTERHKPHPEPVLMALRHLGYAPAEAIFVGDSPYDMQAGCAAGVTAVGVAWGAFGEETLRASGASRVLKRPTDLLPYVSELLSS
jgi:pyrophosphatase PpaX